MISSLDDFFSFEFPQIVIEKWICLPKAPICLFFESCLLWYQKNQGAVDKTAETQGY